MFESGTMNSWGMALLYFRVPSITLLQCLGELSMEGEWAGQRLPEEFALLLGRA